MKSPIKWTGGKTREIKYFQEYVPQFNVYVEPFFGGGALYWHLQPDKAIINDINPHLMNFYEVLRDDYNELYKYLQKMELNREYFQYIVDRLNNKKYKNKAEQAAVFYYLNKTAFSGKWRVNSKGDYNNTWGNYKKENFKVLDKKYSEILQSTIVKSEDYKTIMEEYKENKHSFIFLDPPYLNCDTMYTANQKFEPIYDYIYSYMKNCQCKVLLVCKGDEYIYNLFKDLIRKRYSIRYSHNALSNIRNQHLVIANY